MHFRTLKFGAVAFQKYTASFFFSEINNLTVTDAPWPQNSESLTTWSDLDNRFALDCKAQVIKK